MWNCDSSLFQVLKSEISLIGLSAAGEDGSSTSTARDIDGEWKTERVTLTLHGQFKW